MLLRGKLERSEWEEWSFLLIVEGPVIIEKKSKYTKRRGHRICDSVSIRTHLGCVLEMGQMPDEQPLLEMVYKWQLIFSDELARLADSLTFSQRPPQIICLCLCLVFLAVY